MNRTVIALKQINNYPSLAIRRRKISSVRCTTAPWLYNRPWACARRSESQIVPPLYLSSTLFTPLDLNIVECLDGSVF